MWPMPTGRWSFPTPPAKWQLSTPRFPEAGLLKAKRQEVSRLRTGAVWLGDQRKQTYRGAGFDPTIAERIEAKARKRGR
jgi:hypothetical protein